MQCIARHGRADELDPRERELNEDQIQEAAELEADFLEMSHALKSEAFVETERSDVFGVDSSDHHVLAQGCGARDQGLQQSGAG